MVGEGVAEFIILTFGNRREIYDFETFERLVSRILTCSVALRYARHMHMFAFCPFVSRFWIL